VPVVERAKALLARADRSPQAGGPGKG
jgi:hypothetical protein